MARNIVSFPTALFLVLTSVFAARRSLNSIHDLVSCHQCERTNILQLLHWFACEVEIYQENVIGVPFDPDSGDYGSHRYQNRESVLDPLPSGYQYYTIGNINQVRGHYLPSYVVNSQRNFEWNTARILIRVNVGRMGAQTGQIIDQVFITRHIAGRSSYDPNNTYRITTECLSQIRKYSIEEIHQMLPDVSESRPFRNTTNHHYPISSLPSDTRINMPETRAIEEDSCCSFCPCFFFCLIILAIVLWSYFGN